MPAELRRRERAERKDLGAGGARVRDRPGYELLADAPAAEERRNLGVVDDDQSRAGAREGQLGDVTIFA